jgi:hypothetical protein
MALKLRRGLSTTRTSNTFAEGELVYTTDTKLLYVGDGVTPGGTLVTGSGGGGVEINGITDNTSEGTVVMTLGDTLITLDAAVALGGDLDITNYQIDGDGDINITGDITAGGVGTGVITANSFVGDGSGLTGITASGPFTGNLTGNVSGDLTGSVFADDSAIMFDGTDGTIFADVIVSRSVDTFRFRNDGSPNTGLKLDVEGNDRRGELLATRKSASDLTGDTSLDYGSVSFGRNDANGLLRTVYIGGRENAILFGQSSTGDFVPDTNFFSWVDQQFGIGTKTPAAELDVVGDANVSGTLTAGNIVSDAAGTPEISSASDIIITANSGAGNFEVDSAKLLIDDVDLKAKLDLNIEGVVMMGKESSSDPTAFVPGIVNTVILSSIANDDTLDGTDRVKEIFRYRFDRYSSGGEILLAINDFGTATGADQFLVKKFLFHDSAGDGSAWTVTEIGTSGNAGLFTSLTVGLDNPGGGLDFFLTFTLRSPDAAISGASMIVTGQTTFTSNPLAVTISGY